MPTSQGSGFEAGDGADYPCIGIAQHVFIQTNKVAGAAYKHWRVVLRNADKMAQGLPGNQIDGWEWWGWNNPDGKRPTSSSRPCITEAAADRIFLVNKWGNNAEVWAIDHPLTPQQSYARADVKLPGTSGSLINGPQKGVWWPIHLRSRWDRRLAMPFSRRFTVAENFTSPPTTPKTGTEPARSGVGG